MAGRRRSGFCRSIVAPEKEDEETVGRTVFRTMGRSFRLSDMISLARRWSCLMSVLRVFRPRAKSEERRAKSEERRAIRFDRGDQVSPERGLVALSFRVSPNRAAP